MRTTLKNLSLVTLLTASLVSGVAAPAYAPAWASVNVQTHVATGNTTYMKTESAALHPAQRLFFGADYNFLNDPLVELNPARTERRQTLVQSIQTMDLTAGMIAPEFAGFYLSVPLHLVREQAGNSSFSLGDIRLYSRVPLVAAKRLDFSLIPELRLPTGSQQLFVSSGRSGYGAVVALEYDFGLFTAAANLGYRHSPGAQFREMDYRHQLPMSFGMSYRLAPRLRLNAEIAGARTLPLNRHQNPAEIYTGVQYQLNPELSLSGGAGVGAVNGISSADYRMIVGLRYAPFAETGDSEEPAPRVSDELRTSRAAPKKTQKPLAPEIFRINQEVLFAHDSAMIRSEARGLLRDLARAVRKNRAQIQRLEIQGHCNELGTDAYNMELGRQRAQAVRSFLIAHGVDADLLAANSYGERQAKPGRKRMGRAEWLRINRRVEFSVTQKM